MIFDFEFDQVMRLSSIRRWGIVEMSADQSVAEHSYNVAMISGVIASRIGLSPHAKCQVIEWALCHDLTELITGDIPSSLKKACPGSIKEVEMATCPLISKESEKVSPEVKSLVKVADYIDAIQFAQKFCVDSRKEAIMAELVIRMNDVIDSAVVSDKDLLREVCRGWLSLKTR